MNNRYYIETMGCQMNKLDSELIINQLDQLGFCRVDNPDSAGVIIFNTCSVRQHAEDKVLTKITQLHSRHKRDHNLILAVLGCMAQRIGQELLDKYEQVAIVCAPGQLHQLGKTIQQTIQAQHQRHAKRSVLLNDQTKADALEQLDASRSHIVSNVPFMAFLRIMRGCNNYCSYCIVPYVRGRERSRPIENIVTEARRLVESGVKEITLLGQRVNAYKLKTNDKTLSLADVLEAVSQIQGLDRLRFVTSYPTNFDRRILQTIADLPNVCPYLHIPAQSGSDRILKAMNRNYTSKDYLELIETARRIIPDVTFAGDFITGFPGEQQQDHHDTLDLIKKVRYKNCFVFRYSPRPGTKADDKLTDDVPLEIKQQRLAEILELLQETSLQDNQRFVNRRVEILVESPSKKPQLNKNKTPATQLQLVGRTPGDHIVVFYGKKNLIGKIIELKIKKASALTLFGEI